jgi:uncharacterized membrane protein YhaH (DUF805 family)
MKYMFLPFARIADYKGRSGRREYWMFQALQIACGLLLAAWLVFSGAVVAAPPISGDKLLRAIGAGPILLAVAIYALVLFPTSLALRVRRWHDIGNSGWTIAVILVFSAIPFIGFLAWIVDFAAACWPGDKGSNLYGPPPSSSD